MNKVDLLESGNGGFFMRIMMSLFMFRPTLGFKTSDLNIISNRSIAADDSLHPLQYFQTCVKGPPGKKHRLCLQTTADDLQQRCVTSFFLSLYIHVLYYDVDSRSGISKTK